MGGNGRECRRRVDGSGVTSTVLRYKGTRSRFLLKGGGALLSNTAV